MKFTTLPPRVPDYVKAQWLVLQQESPDDYVIATGEQHSVREFCQLAFEQVGIHLDWRGEGPAEQGIIAALSPSPLLDRYSHHCKLPEHQLGKPVVMVDPGYFRPTEVETLIGDATKARSVLGWQPEVSFRELVEEMVAYDLNESVRESICRRDGFPLPASCEAGM